MGTSYIFEPVDRQDPANWEYTNTTILDEGLGNIIGECQINLRSQRFSLRFIWCRTPLNVLALTCESSLNRFTDK